MEGNVSLGKKCVFICDCFAEIMESLFLNCADTWCRGFDNIDLWRGSFGSHGNMMSNFLDNVL